MGVRHRGHFLGVHRSLEPLGVLPQSAERVDNSLPIYSNELLIEVEKLNIDAASFIEMEQRAFKEGVDIFSFISDEIIRNTEGRGKQQNPNTGSGGMLLGWVKQVGPDYSKNIEVGKKVATMVSLTATPLKVSRVLGVDSGRHQVKVEGYAILFESSPWATVPDDLPEDVVLAALDVAGAPALVLRHIQGLGAGAVVVILGALGKAGLLSAAAIRKFSSEVGLIGIDYGSRAFERAGQLLGLYDEVIDLDVRDPIAVRDRIYAVTHGKMGDVVVNVTNVAATEMAAVLAGKQDAVVIFFNMATSFTKATLGAEGIGYSSSLVMGNGFVPGHVDLVLDLIRDPAILSWFKR